MYLVRYENKVAWNDICYRFVNIAYQEKLNWNHIAKKVFILFLLIVIMLISTLHKYR